jgi:hypothetical protein
VHSLPGISLVTWTFTGCHQLNRVWLSLPGVRVVYTWTMLGVINCKCKLNNVLRLRNNVVKRRVLQPCQALLSAVVTVMSLTHVFFEYRKIAQLLDLVEVRRGGGTHVHSSSVHHLIDSSCVSTLLLFFVPHGGVVIVNGAADDRQHHEDGHLREHM